MFLGINLARGEAANRISISAWIIRHYQEILPNDYELWFKNSAGVLWQVPQGYTLDEAVEFARTRLPGKRVVDFSIWPQLDFKFKTEFDEKKVFDF